jgi:hypothetical protein
MHLTLQLRGWFMKKRILLTVLMGVAATSLQAADTDLAALKETYARETRKLDAQFEASAEKIVDAYGKSLDGAIRALKKEGDPDGVLAAIAEKRRFEAEKTVPAESAGGLLPLLRDAWEAYHAELAKADASRMVWLVELSRKYVDALDGLMKKLTAEEKLALALNVKQEKGRAEFVLADVQSRIPADMEKTAVRAGTKRYVTLPMPLKRDLVLHYGFDRNERERATDKSGKRHHGKVRGGAWEKDGLAGGALALDEARDHVYIGSTGGLELKGEMSVAVWVKSATGGGRILSNERVWEHAGDFTLYPTGYTYYYGNNKYRSCHLEEGGRPGADEWHHLVLVHAGATVKLWLDGESARFAEGFPGFRSNGSTLVVGTPEKRYSSLKGMVDELMVWNRALSDAEVKQVYQLAGGK